MATKFGTPIDFNLLKAALQEQADNEQPGRVPASMNQNIFFSSLPRTYEQEREAKAFDAFDDADAASIQNDQKAIDAERNARTFGGYRGTYPLQEQSEADLQDKMRLAQVPGQQAIGLERAKGEEQRRTIDKFAAVQSFLNGGGRQGSAPPPEVPDTSYPAGAPDAMSHALSTQRALQAYKTRQNSGANSAPAAPKVYLDDQGNEVGANTGTTENYQSPYATSRPEFKMNMGMNGGVSFTQAPERKLTANGAKSVEDVKNALRMMGDVRDLIVKNGPAPDPVDPQPKPLPGFFGQLMDSGRANLSRTLYGSPFNFQDPTLSGDPVKADIYNKTTQLVELSKVLATKGLMGGSRNLEWIHQIQDHVAKGNMPTQTMLQRLDDLIPEYQKMIDTIYETERQSPYQYPQPQEAQ